VSLRARLTLAGGGAVFAALAIASLVIYAEVRSKLHDQVDVSLIQAAEGVSSKWVVANGRQPPSTTAEPKGKRLPSPFPQGDPAASKAPLLLGKDGSGYFQIVRSFDAVGNGGLSATGAPLAAEPAPGSAAPGPKLLGHDESVANGLSPPYFRNVRFAGGPSRLYTMRLPSSSNGLVRTIRPLTETNSTIARVRWLLIGLTLGGALAAALLGRLAANAVLRPVRALAGAVREVSATRDLERRIPVGGRDELASLAADFNTMLAALDESQHAQQQLIADASHELRTPLTAHRANIELLARPDLPVERRQRVLGAAVRGIEELSSLVGDLIQAAREGRSVDAREEVALDELVATAVERARHRAPLLRFESRLEPYRLVAAPARLERALDNVLDNAIKWSPPGGAVEVGIARGTLTVRDHGPGIAGADLPHVFDRFYRAAAARAQPGSGLGLAIVKQTVADHGGTVTVANADGGGTLLTLRFDADGR
jgi:two-component system, OmpR family, sensor histidine kinase MprB